MARFGWVICALGLYACTTVDQGAYRDFVNRGYQDQVNEALKSNDPAVKDRVLQQSTRIVALAIQDSSQAQQKAVSAESHAESLKKDAYRQQGQSHLIWWILGIIGVVIVGGALLWFGIPSPLKNLFRSRDE